MSTENGCEAACLKQSGGAPPPPACPTITGVAPPQVGIGPGQALTITGTGLDQPGVWSANFLGIPPGPLPPPTISTQSPTQVELFVDTSAVPGLGGPADVVFTPADTACPPVAGQFLVSGA